MENISFDFTIKEKSIGAEEYHDYVRKEYEFFRRNSSGDWVKADSIPHATDESGRFSLKQGQKAVFRRAETHSEYEITEDDSPFWECSSASYYYLDDGNGNPAENYSIVKRENDFYKADTNEKIEPVPSAEDLALYKFERAERINRFRPVVYFEKKISALSDASEMQWLREWDFGFVLKADGNPAANKVYWIVDRAGYEGSIPEKLEEGKTDENGRFTVKAGQIIALFPGEMDSVYKIEEDTSKTYKKGSNTFNFSDYWIVKEKNVQGVLDSSPDIRSITNICKRKKLFFTKSLENQTLEEYRQILGEDGKPKKFTFEFLDDERKPVKNRKYKVFDMDGAELVQDAGTTGSDGKFSVEAGKTVEIEDLTAESKYYVRETDCGSDYMPVDEDKYVIMPLYTESETLDFVNRWNYKPLKIMKRVTYDTYGITAEQINEINNKAFKMRIYTRGSDSGEWIPYADKSFVRSGGSYSGELESATDSNVYFYIHHFETVTFPGMGVEEKDPDIRFKVEEMRDGKYVQIYPHNTLEATEGMPQTPLTGRMDDQEEPLMFVNGQEGVMIIGKEYVLDRTSPDSSEEELELAEDYIDRIRNVALVRDSEKVTVRIEVEYDTSSGKRWQAWPSKDTDVTAVDILDDNLGNPYIEEELADGEAEYEIPEGEHPVHGIQNLVWKDGSAVKLESWKQIVINDFEEGIDQRYGVWTGRYRVYESSGDRHKLYSTDEKGMSLHGGFIEINAQTAEIEDNFRNRPAAVLKNAVKGIIPKSAVRKTTKLGSDEIAEGSRLVFKIERYNGSTWENANGIAYIQGNYDSRRTEKNADPNYSYIDDSIAVREYKYSENGRIKVEKQNLQNAENGRYIFPKIIFPNDEVYVNPENPTKGMLRIYELLDDSETTGDWGRLSRVDTEEANAETGSVLTNTFVNSNREALIEVEKEITGEENPDRNAVFSFELRQITESTANLSAADGALGTNVQYDVYTTDEFGEEQKVNTTRLSTGTDGIIKIKHSEFARLYVNDDTVWIVHELEPVGYSLSDMEVINNAVKLGDNLALMNAKAEVLPERIEADTEYPCFGVYDELKADNVKADVIYTDGSRVDALSENIALKELKETLI